MTHFFEHSLYNVEKDENIPSKNNTKENKINHLSSIPNNIRSLYGVQLELTNISYLKKLTNIHTLDLSQNNKIKNHSILDSLISIRRLYLSFNSISNIHFLKGLMNIEILDISNNSRIKDYNILRSLKNLKELYLSKNNIYDISFLDGLINIQRLYIWDNNISDISTLKSLKNINRLSLAANNIHDIHPLKGLSKITYLDLQVNNISNIHHLKELQNICMLNLSINNISDITPLIFFIKNSINIELEYHFNTDKNTLNLTENPLTHPPESIIREGNQAILRYFKNLEKEGVETIQEAKLILVGEGSVGKTSLCKKLIDEEAELPKKDERTRGVEIEQLNFKNKEGKKFTANIWDFGGQNIYYATHRFFMTPRSLYVLMAQTRNNTDNNFDYWMPNIALFGKESPILIARNKIDGFGGTPLSISRFQKDNSPFNIKDQPFEINLKNNEGLAALKKEIIHQIQKLPHIGDTVPTSWKDTRDDLLELNDDYISFEKFKNICQENKLKNSADIKSFGLYLHDIGGILWYHDILALKSKIILNPQWATDAVFKIIDEVDKNPLRKKKGTFSKEYCCDLWTEEKYADLQDELLELMIAFKLCYKKENSAEYIIPALLEKNSKANDWNEKDNIQIIYEYDFMPRGLVNHITAELHDMILDDEHVWWEGVVLKDKDSDALIKIEEDRLKRTISMNARGNNTDGILKIAMRKMENLHKHYLGINYKKMVSCPCNFCKKSKNPQWYDYKEITEKLRKNRNYQFCNKTENEDEAKIYIPKILYNIGMNTKDISDLIQSKRRNNILMEDNFPDEGISFSLTKDVESIRELIGEAEFKKAFQKIKTLEKKVDSDKRDNIILFRSRYSKNKLDRILGTSTQQEDSAEKNKLILDFLKFLSELEELG